MVLGLTRFNDGIFFAFRNNCNIRARPFELIIITIIITNYYKYI